MKFENFWEKTSPLYTLKEHFRSNGTNPKKGVGEYLKNQVESRGVKR